MPPAVVNPFQTIVHGCDVHARTCRLLYQILGRALVRKFKGPQHGTTTPRCAIGKHTAICIKDRIGLLAHKFGRKTCHSDGIIFKSHPRFCDSNTNSFALLFKGRFTIWTITDDLYDSQTLLLTH